MKTYPSIDGISCGYLNKLIGQECVCFMKCDGSGLRFEWSKKTGWDKFGTRNRLFDISDKEYGRSIKTFNDNFGVKLAENLKQNFNKIEKAIVFCEFYGPSSFAGHHNFDEDMELCLFDVDIHKKGYVDPFTFAKMFKEFKIPKIYYEGTLSLDLIKNIKDGCFGDNEGVVIKGVYNDRKQHHNIWMIKVKTNYWLNKIKESGYKQILEENEKEQFL